MNLGKYYNFAERDQETIQKLEWVKYVAFVVSAETRQIIYTVFPKNGDKFDFTVHFDVPIPSAQIAYEIDRRYKGSQKADVTEIIFEEFASRIKTLLESPSFSLLKASQIGGRIYIVVNAEEHGKLYLRNYSDGRLAGQIYAPTDEIIKTMWKLYPHEWVVER